MKFVPIFADRLYACQYEGNLDNEYDRLMQLWNDMEYVRNFLKENARDLPKGKTVNQMALKIFDNSSFIDDTLISISENPNRLLDEFFQPLYNHEYNVGYLSLQKGKEQYLRLYAIRIDSDCFLITGGAIKLTHLMKDRKHTQDELVKLEKVKDYLKSAGIFDEDSFYEFLTEHND